MILAHVFMFIGALCFVFFAFAFDEDKRDFSFKESVLCILVAIFFAVAHVAEQLA